MKRSAGPIICSGGVEKPQLRNGYEDDREEGADKDSLVSLLPAVVFAEDVCHEESTSEKDISKSHFNAERIHEEKNLDVCHKRSKYAEGEKTFSAEQSV